MYFRANQDLELTCDEAAVRTLGLSSRKGYAYALLAAAESGFSPLCITYTTKNHMEERIRAIMKIKKRSTAVIICAAMLVAGVSAVFATSPKPAETRNIEDLPPAVMTNQTAKPTPTPTEKEVPETSSERVHPITASVPDDVSQSAPAPTAQDVPDDTSERVHPITSTAPGPDEKPVQPEPTAPALENRWGVPDGEIPMLAEFVVQDQEDEAELGKYLESTHGLYPENYAFGRSGSTGIAFVQVHYYETKARNGAVDKVRHRHAEM